MLRGKLTWAQGNLTDDESRALDSLTNLISADPALGLAVADYPWVSDAITSDEKWALQYLREIHTQDHDLGSQILALPWVVDEITEFEKRGLQYIKRIHHDDLSLGQAVASLPWVQDDITEHERWALKSLSDILGRDPLLGVRIAGLPWIVDEINEAERRGLQYIDQMHSEDRPFGQAVASLIWFQDDITDRERRALRYLKDLHAEDPDLANQLATMPFFTQAITKLDVDSLAAIDNLRENFPEILAQLSEQEWYLDGLDQLEAALVMMVGARGGAVLDPDDLRGFLVKHHADSRSVALPLSGEVELIFIQSARNKLNDDIVDQVEDAIRVLEEFMATPFPVSEVVLLMATPGELSGDFNVAGLNFGTHMVLDPSLARQGDNNRVLNHETAHYYWNYENAPLWYEEGSSEFLSSYIRDQLYDDSLADRSRFVEIRELRYCTAMSTIQKLIDDLERQGYAQHSAMPYFFCNYSTGHNLLLTLFANLGSDAVSAAMADIYQTAITQNRPATEAEIYLAFLRQTTSENSADYKATYLKLHGGDLPDG